MFRVRTGSLSLAATGAAALTLGLVAGPAVAHGFGHHDFRGSHHRHALAGAVQSVDTTANTAVITLGGGRALHTDWHHGSSTNSGTQQVTLDLSGASIFDAAAMKRDCHTGSSATPGHAFRRLVGRRRHRRAGRQSQHGTPGHRVWDADARSPSSLTGVRRAPTATTRSQTLAGSRITNATRSRLAGKAPA